MNGKRSGSVKSVKKNRSVEKVLTIVETMAASSKPMRLHDIARQAGIPTSTALRFLSTLAQHNYVSQDPDSSRYALTLKLCNIANQISFHSTMRDLVRPRLEELASICGESSCLAIEDEGEVVYIDVVEGPDKMLRTLQRIGKRAPLHSTGVGKCLLLNYGQAEIRELACTKGLEKLTEHTIDNPDTLLHELESVRVRGYAVDDEECEHGVRCLAAPLRDYTGRIVASISISGPVSRLTTERIGENAARLTSTAVGMSEELGFSSDRTAERIGAD